jgi:hypothetical protein
MRRFLVISNVFINYHQRNQLNISRRSAGSGKLIISYYYERAQKELILFFSGGDFLFIGLYTSKN